jgi:hypothetical protein
VFFDLQAARGTLSQRQRGACRVSYFRCGFYLRQIDTGRGDPAQTNYLLQNLTSHNGVRQGLRGTAAHRESSHLRLWPSIASAESGV